MKTGINIFSHLVSVSSIHLLNLLQVKKCAVSLVKFFFIHICLLAPLMAQNSDEMQETEKDVDGYRIELFLKDHNTISGNLLSVRDSALMIFCEYQIDGSDKKTFKYEIRMIKNNDIVKLTISEKSKVLSYTLIGMLSGIVLGSIIGFADGDDKPGFMSMKAESKALAGGFTLGIAGIVVGLVTGLLSSAGDKEITPLVNQNFNFLKQYAKYKTEPKYLGRYK